MESQHDVLFHIAGSALAGAVSRGITHPMDTIKARLQVVKSVSESSFSGSKSLAGIGSASVENGRRQQGVGAMGRRILQKEGLRGLYNGVGVSMSLSAPATASFLVSYDYFKAQMVRRGGGADSPVVHLSCGVFAELVSGFVWTPMEVVKQKAQVYSKSPKTVFKEIYKKGGALGFLRGYWASVGVFAPQSALFFATYEQFKLLHIRVTKDENIPFMSYVALSAVAGGLAAGITNPLDIIKTRYQCFGNEGSLLKLAWNIKAEEGLKAYFNGAIARMLWVAPSVAISMSLYECFKDYIQDRKLTDP
eukprot:Nk52_evm61s1737 gene=Nk52_evmTU61s1737